MGNDELFLKRAIQLASESISEGGGPFGAVIVKEGKIIAESFNRVVLNNDPTAHAEILAIRQASAVLKSHELNDCTLYTSCEPCPMCLGAIYWAGIKKIFYSCDRTDAEDAGFSDKLIYNEILLDPTKRKISFVRMTGLGEEEVFGKWNDLENKVAY